uniref:NADH dehydrogenase subunit 3 n=1 Tax=Blastothrix speciosa TaxID=3064204 RepID=UPI00286A0D1E|nr:NADH dehydrogenase subunit 3 [Blastothrix speciosa]WKV28873.1 NADH dehydrogenase subunit 3 [Blastothrix speciosa]
MMMNLIFLFSLVILILFMMMMMNFILSKKLFKDREKMSSFECGFDSMSFNRMPFSLQFYLVTVIFLIFDVEIAMILPFVYLNNLNYLFMILNISIIIIILILGLFMEWLEGALNWFK